MSTYCAQSLSYVQLCNAMECSPPGSSVRGDSPGKNIGVGCHALLQGIFPIQGIKPWSLSLAGEFFTSTTWDRWLKST